jgi:hypothetical protein
VANIQAKSFKLIYLSAVSWVALDAYGQEIGGIPQDWGFLCLAY